MKKIRLSEVGILPDTDITTDLFRLFAENPEGCEFIFENGDYYFSPQENICFEYRLSNSYKAPVCKLGVWMKEMKNCVLSGNGARLYFSGQMQPFTLDRCENIKISDFVVNWKKPLAAEGIVKALGEGYLDVIIDNEKFPHRLLDGVLEFDVGADEWYKANGWLIAFEPNELSARRSITDFNYTKISLVSYGIYRLETSVANIVRVGDILNIRHNERIHAGIFCEKSDDTVIENVTFHSCGGLGCLAQFCHNITCRGVHFLPDRAAGRMVSSCRDDGMHITCCSGRVSIYDCSFHALMDDPINVHGCCVTCDEAVDDKTLRCKYRHEQACAFDYWAKAGDEIALIARDTMNKIFSATASSYELEDDYTFLLRFEEPLDKKVLELAKKGDSLALDNLTNTAEFYCIGTRFGSCRARGVLVATPKKVMICDNYFESSGSAILVAGDSNYWFESGRCNDVTIKNNVFTGKCNGAEYQFCEGVISVCPVVPKPDAALPFHGKIEIVDNVFDLSCESVLYGFSCEDLIFSGNRIFKSTIRTGGEDAIYRFSFCPKVTISDNKYTGFSFKKTSVCAENCGKIVCND